MKPSLSLNYRDIGSNRRTLGMKELLTYLHNSDLFDITYHNERLRTMRGERATVLFYNGYKIYLDCWEYNTPTYSDNVMKEDFDLIVKLYHKDVPKNRFEKSFQRKKILLNFSKDERMKFLDKVVPWTFFPSRMMFPYIGKEEELVHLPTERLIFFCGMGWKGRQKMEKRLTSLGAEFIRSQQATRRGKKLSNQEYLNKMLSSKYGLVLAGRASQCTQPNNRREIDYMMMKKPMLINYEPYYYNPLVNGEHYILINENTDFDTIGDNHDLDAIAENAYQWYLENASPEGAAKSFLKIMQDRFE